MSERLEQLRELLRDALTRGDDELLAIVLGDIALEFPTNKEAFENQTTLVRNITK